MIPQPSLTLVEPRDGLPRRRARGLIRRARAHAARRVRLGELPVDRVVELNVAEVGRRSGCVVARQRALGPLLKPGLGNLLADDQYVARGLDADPDRVAVDLDDRDGHFGSDLEPLTELPAQDQHGLAP